MSNLSYADIVSSLALFTALVALMWNIYQDIISDKVSVEFYVTFGEAGNVKGRPTGLFADAGSLLPDHKFDNLGTLIKIINTGRIPIAMSGVGGKLKSGSDFAVVVAGLPKMLQPYEIFSEITQGADQNLMKWIQGDQIQELWVRDTKNRKWLLSTKGWEQLKKTAEYISSNKHLSQSNGTFK